MPALDPPVSLLMAEKVGRPPAEQWWTINGEDVMEALRRCHEGTPPDLVYLELIANSTSEDLGPT